MSDGTVEISQEECAVNIKPITVAPSRRRLRTEPCTAVEVTMLRGRYGSLLAQHMVLAWAAAGGDSGKPVRIIRKMDAKNAYLQGDAITRELYLRPPAGGIPGVEM